MDTASWYYVDYASGTRLGPFTLQQLDSLHEEGKIEDPLLFNEWALAHPGPGGPQGIQYSLVPRINVQFVPTVEEFHAQRAARPVTVLSGPNNCGKTLLLKQCGCKSAMGVSHWLQPLLHVDVLNSRQISKNDYRRFYDDFRRQYETSHQNIENNPLGLEIIITSLKDTQRTKMFRLCEDLLGNHFSLKRIDADNEFSPFYVDMDGENLRYGSSGTRLLLTLLGILLDERFTTVLIDEPELGLSPHIQTALARFMYKPDLQQQYCPHLHQVYVATHSHLFLDRAAFSNNFAVTKTGSVVSIKPVQSVADLHQLQFKLLGNELESIFLPSAIVIVEGASDVTFMTKVVQLHIPERKVAIVRGGGDGGALEKLDVLKETFGDLATSPYRDRLFVVLDKIHSTRLDRFERNGIQRENITVWSRNGIEYLYPAELRAAIFRCEKAELDRINFEADPIEYNGIRKSKKELAQLVVDRMTAEHELNQEITALVSRIAAACK